MPKNLWTFILSIACTVLAPTLAIIVVTGTKIRKAGIFIKPILNGRFVLNKVPDVKNPIAPNKEIINPIDAAVPIAFLIE